MLSSRYTYIKSIAHRCQGLENKSVMTDYCCMLYSDTPDIVFHKKKKIITFLTFNFSTTDDVVYMV